MENVLLACSNAAYAFGVEFRVGGSRHNQIEDNFLNSLCMRFRSGNLPCATDLPHIHCMRASKLRHYFSPGLAAIRFHLRKPRKSLCE
jgi:hypothetical protein